MYFPDVSDFGGWIVGRILHFATLLFTSDSAPGWFSLMLVAALVVLWIWHHLTACRLRRAVGAARSILQTGNGHITGERLIGIDAGFRNLKSVKGKGTRHRLAVARSARFEAARNILVRIHERRERVLIFTEDRRMQAFVAQWIRSEFGLDKVRIINGATTIARRKQYVTEFQRHVEADDGFDVMILSPRAAGVGLTLTAATHVIHLSRWWNPAVEEQCNDRIYRIGQRRNVTVHLPLAIHPTYREGSFDCVLNDLMRRKTSPARAALWPPTDNDFDNGMLVTGVSSAEPFDPTVLDELDWSGFEDWVVDRARESGIGKHRKRRGPGTPAPTPCCDIAASGQPPPWFRRNTPPIMTIWSAKRRFAISFARMIATTCATRSSSRSPMLAASPTVLGNWHWKTISSLSTATGSASDRTMCSVEVSSWQSLVQPKSLWTGRPSDGRGVSQPIPFHNLPVDDQSDELSCHHPNGIRDRHRVFPAEVGGSQTERHGSFHLGGVAEFVLSEGDTVESAEQLGDGLRAEKLEPRTGMGSGDHASSPAAGTVADDVCSSTAASLMGDQSRTNVLGPLENGTSPAPTDTVVGEGFREDGVVDGDFSVVGGSPQATGHPGAIPMARYMSSRESSQPASSAQACISR